MDNIKLSVTFELPGSQMLTSQECEENPKENYKNEQISFISTVKVREGKKVVTKYKKETFNIKIRKCKPASQCINMTDVAYKEMISNTPVSGIPPSTWKKMSKNERVMAHLNLIKNDLNALSYTFNVLYD